MTPDRDSNAPAPEWISTDCSATSGSAPGLGVSRWHLDSAEFNVATRCFRLRGWVVGVDSEVRLHVVARHSGELRSYLPNEVRADVVEQVRKQGAGASVQPWCGFFIQVPAAEQIELGFERAGDIVWVLRSRRPGTEKPAEVVGGQTDGETGAGEERLVSIARRYGGPGPVRLLESREPPDSRDGRVVIHDLEVDAVSTGHRLRLVEKRGPTRHELAVARRLLVTPGTRRVDGFVSVLEVSDPTTAPAWFVCEYVEPQLNMYLDPTPFIGQLTESVVRVNRSFADLAGDTQRSAAIAIFHQAIETLAHVDRRLGTSAARVMVQAIPELLHLPVVASHNDFYWNNLGLERGDDGQVRVRMFDLELLGPNVMGAEFHQFARMVMESETFREPFAALVESYARATGVDPRMLRIAALSYALVRSGSRLRGGLAIPKRADGSPRCEEPQAWTGLVSWLERELRESGA